jgi:branched-chain amino acid transport system permease protein
MEFFVINVLNGLSYGLLLFMLSAGLTLIFSMMGVLNFAHASFYMLGAYFGYWLNNLLGFWLALVLAPLICGLLGAVFERWSLRKVYAGGHVSELLLTFGLSYLILEGVQIIWGRSTVAFKLPESLQGPVVTLVSDATKNLSLVWRWQDPSLLQSLCVSGLQNSGALAQCTPFPMNRLFIMLCAILMMALLWGVLNFTRLGLIIKAALTQPKMVEALGHDVPSVFMLVFALGTALAGLAGVIGGSTFITEPAMAASVGSVTFVVVVVGGIGSLVGAFLASILIGMIQTFAVAIDTTLMKILLQMHIDLGQAWQHNLVLNLTLTQVAPILPYLLLVLVLILKPGGLLGKNP